MSNHLTPERLADIQGAQKEEWSIYPDDVDDLLAHIDEQEATIQRIRDLHKPGAHISVECRECMECSNGESIEYPCPTIQALDEDQQ